MKLKSNTEDLRTVLRALFENQSAYESGHELPHRILCVGTGGGFCCSIVAAEFHALQDAGLTHPFTTILTVSGSGGPAGGYLSGVAHRVGRVFEYLATSKFVTWNPYTMSVALDLKHFERALDGSHMPLSFDSKKIRAHTSDFWVTAAEEDGTKVLINAKSETYEPLQAVLASIAVPGTCDPVTLEGRRLVDGVAGGNPLPVEEGLSLLPLREGERAKVLVLQSRIHPKYRPLEYWAWPFLAHMRFALAPSGLRSNMAYIDSCFASAADKLSLMRAIDYCRVAPTPGDVTLLPTTTSMAQIRAAMEEARAFMARELALARVGRMV
jgi:predicted patatin/cPLA2 family phospholipase